MNDRDKRKSLRVEVLEQMGKLATSGFGLVAALAWNDFIKALFIKVFPEPGNNLLAMLGYAVLITVLVVTVTYQLGRLLEVAKHQVDIKDTNETGGDDVGENN